MPGTLARLRAMLPGHRSERRQVRALARRLRVSEEDATRILRRSREVGFGVAMTEEAEAGRDTGAALDE